MKQDPRTKNIWFDATTPTTYWSEYRAALTKAVDSVSSEKYSEALALVEMVAVKDGNIFVCGNGGSSAIAEHLTCDWTKGASGSKLRIKTQCLSSNSSLLMAIANDFSFDDVFAKQIELLGHKGDLLITISSSGNSPNVVKAIGTAREMGMKSLSFTGFAGGKSKDLADVNLHVEFSNYAIVEDAHQALMQSMAQFLYRKFHKE